MNKILQKFGGEIAFLNRDDEYFNTSVPYSQYVLNDNTIYSPDGTDTGFAYDQQDNEEFYGVVFQDWAGIGTGTNSAFHFAYNQEAGGYSPTDPNNPYNDITNYDPTSDRIDILDLQGYMSVGNTLHGEGVYNGDTIQGLYYTVDLGDKELNFSGEKAFDTIMTLESAKFQGDLPSVEEMEDIFDVTNMADLRTTESCTRAYGQQICEETTTRDGQEAPDGSGWVLAPGVIGDKYHCLDAGRSADECFKFSNTQTGQEVIYADDGSGLAIDNTYLYGGTFNYANAHAGNVVRAGAHFSWDMKTFEDITMPIAEEYPDLTPADLSPELAE